MITLSILNQQFACRVTSKTDGRIKLALFFRFSDFSGRLAKALGVETWRVIHDTETTDYKTKCQKTSLLVIGMITMFTILTSSETEYNQILRIYVYSTSDKNKMHLHCT